MKDHSDLVGQTFRSPDSIIDHKVTNTIDDTFVGIENTLTGKRSAAIADFVRLAIADNLHGERSRAVGDIGR